jgi:hypothetical protein
VGIVTLVEYGSLHLCKVFPSGVTDLDSDRDLFIAGFTPAERVVATFPRARATRKLWLLFPEYGLAPSSIPAGDDYFYSHEQDEAEYIESFLDKKLGGRLPQSICIDITGLLTHHLSYLMKRVFDSGIDAFEVVYSEPVQYREMELTRFTRGPVLDVRQVRGFEGPHIVGSSSQELLIIGTGYDHELIRRAAEHRASARKLPLFGLPPLQPDMYQENQLRTSLAAETLGAVARGSELYAPAANPFATAQVLHEEVERQRARTTMENLYLSSLGTKAQAVGFTLFYLTELEGTASSLIVPIAESYEADTTVGRGRTWHYVVERPLVI